MSTPGFDPDLFLEYLGDDRELAVELLTAFTEDAPVRLTDLTSAVEALDFESATRSAHSLKGMCGVLRDREVAALALEMETAARTRDEAALHAALPKLTHGLREVLDRAAAFLASGPRAA
ncbi:Hpt domain-containing protein [Desulfovibrio aminophilus]|uniref:Hpt domain-containing protein n=1 Tax=Desulfovibrio aminophilus TaxID=81425 RepID=UPI000401EABF|nr:Hpt domain-containing protein [Desulfovibrio aminophilus]